MSAFGFRLWNLVKAVLFRFDPERVHRATVGLIRHTPNSVLRCMAGQSGVPQASVARVWGLEFRSRVGLAAGFDKDAEMLEKLPHLGFGFAEIGTVTPRPQSGNARPRLFRDIDRQAVFNRMGFNGLGAEVVSHHLRAARAYLPESFRVGVNLGKNKDTPIEKAVDDYVAAARYFAELADYVVINVSSPNTPQLRTLQRPEALRPLVGGVREVLSAWRKSPPLLLKLAPEVEGEELATLLQQGQSWGIDGWVLTNTLAGVGGGNTVGPGGWSGAPLTDLSRQRLIEARKQTTLPIISVGGILSEGEARLRFEAGASLIQIYSGWIFNGPRFISRL